MRETPSGGSMDLETPEPLPSGAMSGSLRPPPSLCSSALVALGCGLLAVGLVAHPAQAQPDADPGTAPRAGPESAAGDGEGEAPGEDGGEVLQVVVAGNAPFVAEGDPPTRGIAVELFREAMGRLEVETQVRRRESAQDAVDAVARGEADLAVGAISITSERAAAVAFTQPWTQGALAIAARAGGETLWSRIRPFATRTFLGGVGTLLAVLFVVGTLFWITERRRNPEHFPAAPLPGIANGVWLALVTMTTVGYGDRVPVTAPGRLVASVWMVVALLTASSLTAFLSTALTLSQISAGEVRSASDLRGLPVAVIEGTTSEAFARRRGARTVPVDDVDDALARLDAGRVDAVVFDRPVLRWFLAEHPEMDVVLSDASYEPVGYGFAMPHERSKLRRELNVALLDLAENGVVDRVIGEWLGGSEQE